MRLRRIARPLARKGLSVIAAFLLSELPNFSSDLERRLTPVEITADRNRSIVVVESQKRRSRLSRSALTLNGNDGAPMGAFANLLVLVLGLNLEPKLAPIHLEQLGAHRHFLAFWGGSEMLDVHLEADGGVPLGQICLYGLDAGTLHQPDHRWRGQYAIASHVLDHQLVVDCRDDLGFETWCQATGWHVSLSVSSSI